MLVTDVSVRCATLDDVPALVVLMAAFYAESSYPLDDEWASGSFRKLLSNPSLGCAWLASAGGNAIGHAVLTARYTMEHGASSGYVDDLYMLSPSTADGVSDSPCSKCLFANAACASWRLSTSRSVRHLRCTPSLALRLSLTGESYLPVRFVKVSPDPFIERTSASKLRCFRPPLMSVH